MRNIYIIIIIINHHDDILVTKVNHSGALVWQNNYGGSRTDVPASIITDGTGNIYFGCMSFSDDGDVQSGNMGGYDFWIVKIDTSGQIIWEQTFGGSRTDYAAYLIYLENGNILAYGATFSHDYDVDINYGYLDFWLWEITPDGEIVRSRVFGSTEPDNIFSLIQTKDGGFFTAARAGTNTAMVNGIPKGQDDVWLLKLDADLNIEWQKLLGGSKYDAGGRGVTELKDGGYIINGITQSSDGDVHGNDFPDIPDQDDIWVVRIDSIGNILWDIALGGNEWESDSKIFQNQDGNFTVFGTTKSMNNGDVEGHHYHSSNPNFPNEDIWMVQLSAYGEILNQRCFGNVGRDRIRRGVIKKSNSHYLLAGTAWSLPDDTIGDVNGGYESTSYDIWFFEIKDCNQINLAPPAPLGLDSVCLPYEEAISYYSSIALEEYNTQWQLFPASAGNLQYQLDTAHILWNPSYEGTAQLSLKTINECGESPYSDSLTIKVFAPLLQMPTGPDTICTVHSQKSTFTTQNPNQLNFQWHLEPANAGSLVQLKDTAIITGATATRGKHN
ncbi:MAG: hypothetical protein B7C24_12500 [Bacteroidetes bacterium 4572_77]|nr:MAG: hypothetical protein B7C24_12500 [Bacteroidetes bacterium 4572_77]